MISDNKSRQLKLAIIILIPILLYGSSVTFDYVLDDALYITDNEFTKKGFSGIWDHLSQESLVGFYGEQKSLLTGGRYRPLAPITYSIEFAIYGLRPGVSHAINILLYSLLLSMLYRLLSRISKREPGFLDWAFWAVLLYAVHPLHVEVVANIKGRDQILGMIAVVGAALLSFESFKNRRLYLPMLAVVFLLGLLAKENVITFLPVIPLMHYFFKNKTLKNVLPIFLTLLISSVVWFLLRSWAIQGFESVESTTLLNDPYLNSTEGESIATTLYTWLLYIKLLILPYPLTYDYYPFHIAIRSFADPAVICSLIIHLFLLVVAVLGLRKRSVISFLIILYAATFSISSNLFFNIGTFMNERFMFEPSLAFCLFLGLVFFYKVPGKFRMGVALVFLIPFSILSFSRTFAWKDNYTLMTGDVLVSDNSIKGLMASGGMLMERAKTTADANEKERLLEQSITYLTKATELMPAELNNFRLLGMAYLEKEGINNQTRDAFLEVFRQNPNDLYTVNNVLYVVANVAYAPQSRVDFGRSFFEYMQGSSRFYFRMGTTYGRDLGDLPNAIAYLRVAADIEPNNVTYLRNLGTALAISGDHSGSIPYFEKALEIEPNNKDLLMAIALSYENLGQHEQAQLYRERTNQ